MRCERARHSCKAEDKDAACNVTLASCCCCQTEDRGMFTPPAIFRQKIRFRALFALLHVYMVMSTSSELRRRCSNHSIPKGVLDVCLKASEGVKRKNFPPDCASLDENGERPGRCSFNFPFSGLWPTSSVSPVYVLLPHQPTAKCSFSGAVVAAKRLVRVG